MNVLAVEALYQQHLQRKTAIAPHLPALRLFASACDRVIEFGVKAGASSTALLLGAREQVTSYDVVATPQARRLETLAGSRWTYRIHSSLDAPVESCDLLFIDSLHTYQQCKEELRRHAGAVQRWLLFHDTITFGTIGAKGESGAHLWTSEPGQSVPEGAWGIRLAIDELMIRDPTWQIVEHYPYSHGLLVLERRR